MKINKLTIIAFCFLGLCAFAQNPQLEETLMALKQNQANNKQMLAQGTRYSLFIANIVGTDETQIFTLNGEVLIGGQWSPDGKTPQPGTAREAARLTTRAKTR
jgi:hypothetical protein